MPRDLIPQETILRITAPAKNGESDVDRQALLLPGVKGAYLRQNPDRPVKLQRAESREIRRGRSPRRNNQAEEYFPLLYHPPKGNKAPEGVCERFNQAILEVEDPSDKVVIMALMEGLRPGLLFNSLSKNVLEPLSVLPNKADKYIAAEELVEAKRRRKYVANRQPPNSPERRYGDNRPTAGDIQVIHGSFGSGGCTSSSKKRHVRNAQGRAKEEVYNLSSSLLGKVAPLIAEVKEQY
ncbi:hypothetical protein Acr_00g0061810 [Actinidia rufa]|uniref:Uncharacterized protein n=1 Tax=Actinidia rufa TaxID=165716 RepID=A0A7J0DNR5_9ERIC|nr:hypothetical protein Acr_00g0061810 [Actinidia rufa]